MYTIKRETSYYSGREYDQLTAKINQLSAEKATAKQKLIDQVSCVLEGQDPQLIASVTASINSVLR